MKSDKKSQAIEKNAKPIYLNNLLPVFGRKGISFPFIFTGKGLTLHFPGGARLSKNRSDYSIYSGAVQK